MMTPPATCDVQVSLLTTSPQSCTAVIALSVTTPVSVSTSTSAACTPHTWTLETCGFWAPIGAAQSPLPLASSIPSRAQNSFQPQLFWFLVSTTLPGSIARCSGSAPTRGPTFLNRSSSAASAPRRVAGACDGQVVLPPEPVEYPKVLSPSLVTMSFGSRP